MNEKKIIPKLLRIAFEQDMKALEKESLNLLRRYRKEEPLIAEEIKNILSNYSIGVSPYRSIGLEETPKDQDSNFPLIKVVEPFKIRDPFLKKDVANKIDSFIYQWEKKEELLGYGLPPEKSILLYGEPGVGKTYTAKWIAYKLELPLLVLDLSSTISSYLGKTGQNIKQVLEYAKSFDSVLFLDEFDAIAKRRDDTGDIGELKRIVNVLLKELEDWPNNGIVIAATNHPEMLDKAIWRRFDLAIELTRVDNTLLREIIKDEFDEIKKLEEEYIKILEIIFKDQTMAKITKLCDSIKRNYILSKNRCIEKSIFFELKEIIKVLKKEEKIEIMTILEKFDIPKKEIIKMLEISQSTYYRIKK